MTEAQTSLQETIIKWLKSYYVVSHGDPTIEPWNEAIDCLIENINTLKLPNNLTENKNENT